MGIAAQLLLPIVLGPGVTGYADLPIKLLLTVLIVVLVAKNRKYARIPRGLGGADRRLDAARGGGRGVVAVPTAVGWQTDGVQVPE